MQVRDYRFGFQEEIISPQINKRSLFFLTAPRPESIESGHSVLCKIEHDTILKEIEKFNVNAKSLQSDSPYGISNAISIIYIKCFPVKAIKYRYYNAKANDTSEVIKARIADDETERQAMKYATNEDIMFIPHNYSIPQYQNCS